MRLFFRRRHHRHAEETPKNFHLVGVRPLHRHRTRSRSGGDRCIWPRHARRKGRSSARCRVKSGNVATAGVAWASAMPGACKTHDERAAQKAVDETGVTHGSSSVRAPHSTPWLVGRRRRRNQENCMLPAVPRAAGFSAPLLPDRSDFATRRWPAAYRSAADNCHRDCSASYSH